MDKSFEAVSIRIPVYNDLDSIKQILKDIDSEIKPRLSDFEIFIIDDGSSDGTWSFLEREQRKRSNLIIERNEVNLGFGRTLKRVFSTSDKALTFFIPGDNQFPVSNFFRLYNELQKKDIVYGIRKHRADNFTRVIVSAIYNKLVSLLFNVPVYDINSIFLCRKKAQEGIHLHSESAFIHAEFYLNVLRKTNKIGHAIIVHKSRVFGKGGGAKLRVIYSTLKEMLLFRFQFEGVKRK